MSLCALCKGIPFFALPSFPPCLIQHFPVREELLTVFARQYDTDPQGLLGVAHHESLDALSASASSCAMCRLIETGVTMTLTTYGSLASEANGKHLEPIGEPTGKLWICSRMAGGEGFLVLSPASNKVRGEVYLVMGAWYCVDYGTPLSTHFRGRPVYPDPLFPVTLNHIQSWLRECVVSHEPVDSTVKPLPNRVLDVGDQGLGANHVKIVETCGQTGHYATLSHCWGTSPRPSVVTTTGLKSMKAGFPISELSRSFQDAILVTRKLGLRYLWIDGLCICQDSRQDWERESALMTSIFSNAFVTVAATRSASHTQSFCAPRPERMYVPLDHCIEGDYAQVLAFSIPHHEAANGSQYVKMNHEPLSSRGWCLQERYLARRTLHFGSSQISFECRHEFHTEDGYVSRERPKYLDIKNSARDTELSSRDEDVVLWGEIVDDYTSRNLTVASDIFPALSGLARLFAERHSVNTGPGQQKYLAGLWRDNLVVQLAWQTRSGCERTNAYRAPTWSWAALHGGIVLSLDYDFSNNTLELSVVEDVHVYVPGLNPYGEVASAWLRLQAPVAPFRVRRSSSPDHPQYRTFITFDDSEVEQDGIFAIDVKSETERVRSLTDNLLIVPLFVYDTRHPYFDSSKVLRGIVVAPRKADRDDTELCEAITYERVGMVIMSEELTVQEFIAMKEMDRVSSITIV